ncbi:DUF1254 domain-containing protein [Nocardia thailandica]
MTAQPRANGGPALPRRAVLGLGAAALLGGAFVGCGADGGDPETTDDPDPQEIAVRAFVFGYPLVLHDATRSMGSTINTLDHSVLPGPLDRGTVRLNTDMLASQGFLDLGREPLVLSVPAMEPRRFWLFQMIDAWSNTVHTPDSRNPGSTLGAEGPPYAYLLTGPGWSGPVPAGLTHLALPTRTARLLGRVEVDGPADAERVAAIQRQMALVPLSAWLQGARTGGSSRTQAIDRGAEPPAKQIAALDGRTFYDRLCRLMATDQPVAADAPMAARLATLGIVPGGTVARQPDSLLDEGIRLGRQRAERWVDPRAVTVNGWTRSHERGDYGTDYLRRAAVALSTIGSVTPNEVLYPTLWADAADAGGTALRYRITFPPGGLPPVETFWSITAYDERGLMVPNAAGMYAVGHYPAPVAGPDGTVMIAVQHADPGGDVPAGNWLPVPERGRFSLTLRLYAPKFAAREGVWQPPPLVRAD